MESSIIMLDDHTDQATKVMLQKVVDRKKKYDSLHNKHIVTIWITVVSSLLYFYFIYKVIGIPYSYSFEAMFSAYVNKSYNLSALVFIVGMFGFMNLLREKMEKAEKEYHALRCEIIDKSKDLWKQQEAWDNRHIVFEMMKKKYDINLYHENK